MADKFETAFWNSASNKNAPQFYTEKGSHIKKMMDDFYQRTNHINEDFQSQASLDSRFEAGDQSAYFEIHNDIPQAFRKTFSFNRIRRIVNMISGHQRRDRKSTIATPVENGDQITADQYSKILFHVHRNQYVLETISDAFRESLITGLSLLNVWVDFREDPVSGTIKVDNCPYNTFLIDPFFKKKDLSDCNAIWKRSYLTKKQLLSLFPASKSEINDIVPGGNDEKFLFMPENSTMGKSDLIAYDEYYYMDSRRQTLLIDAMTSESMEITKSSDIQTDEIDQFLRLYPSVTVSKQDIPTVKLAVMVNGTLLYDGPNQLGIDEYPFVPVLSYFNPSLASFSDRLQGVVRDLRDPQFLYNRRKAIEDDILSSQVNSGWKYKEGALVNPDDVFLAGQGKGIALTETAEMTDVQQILPSQIPPSMFQLSEQYAKEIMEISGVNEELLGSADSDVAASLSAFRQGRALTTLHGLFDNLNVAQKQLGSIILKTIQANFTPGKVQRIIEEQPGPQFYNKSFGKYDVAIEEGFNTTTQRQAEFAQLIHLKEIGVPIPDKTIIEAATIQNKTQLLQDIEEIQKQEQQQAMQASQAQGELVKAQTNLANAKVESDISLAKERDSRVFSNLGLMEERRHEAEKDKTQSMLNLVKTLQEIDSVDINQLAKLIQLSSAVETSASKGGDVEKAGVAIVGGATKDIPNAPKLDDDLS